jgi:hypothetical protein
LLSVTNSFAGAVLLTADLLESRLSSELPEIILKLRTRLEGT